MDTTTIDDHLTAQLRAGIVRVPFAVSTPAPACARVDSRLVRVFDVAVSVMTLVALFPLFLLIALAVKLDSKGPVFYRQVRVGLNRRRKVYGDFESRDFDRERKNSEVRRENISGQPFQMIKFRTMRTNAEADGKSAWCRENDPRVTRLGRLLRRTHLDELPQFFNILKGDMSLVGPRPERPEYVVTLRERIPNYEKRLLVRPGVTGLAQTRHRADLEIRDVRKKIRYDNFYLQKRSRPMFLMILLETVPISLGVTVDALWKIRRRSPVYRTVYRLFHPKPQMESAPQVSAN